MTGLKEKCYTLILKLYVVRVCHILFADGTTDYVTAEDFDGIYLILL